MARRPIRIDLPLLDELRRVHAEAARLFPRPFDPGLAGVGLIGLDEDPLDQDLRYPSFTPLNARVFAGTGGNGVHFSLLVREGVINGRSPVIVTIPGMMGDSFVVGESLHDFLCLGKDRGYFALEQLSYDLELTLEVYTNPPGSPATRTMGGPATPRTPIRSGCWRYRSRAWRSMTGAGRRSSSGFSRNIDPCWCIRDRNEGRRDDAIRHTPASGR